MRYNYFDKCDRCLVKQWRLMRENCVVGSTLYWGKYFPSQELQNEQRQPNRGYIGFLSCPIPRKIVTNMQVRTT